MSENEKPRILTCGECVFFSEYKGNMGCSAVPGHHIEVVEGRPCCEKYRDPQTGRQPSVDFDEVAMRVRLLEIQMKVFTKKLYPESEEAEKYVGDRTTDRDGG